MMTSTPHPISDPSLWRRADFSDLNELVISLGREEIDAIDEAVERLSSGGVKLEETERRHFAHPRLCELMRSVVAEVLHGRGLVILDGIPCNRYEDNTIAQVFWGLGRYFGNPVSQSVLGDRLGHVMDHSDENPNARGYRNKFEARPHTDFQDVAGFLCLQPGSEGGMSWFASAAAIHNELLKTRPDLVDVLYQGFYMHRYGEEAPGELAITEYRVPAFSERDGYISCRWIPMYADAAEREGVELSSLEREALEVFSDLSARQDIGLGFTLKRGQAALMNNYTVLHGRSAFTDACGGKKRHLIRLWLSCDDKRPVVNEIALYASEHEGRGIAPREGAKPSFNQVARKEQLSSENI